MAPTGRLAARAADRLKADMADAIRRAAAPACAMSYPLCDRRTAGAHAVVLAPAATMLAFEVMLTDVFLAWLGLRLAGVSGQTNRRAHRLHVTDAELPVLHRHRGAVSRSRVRRWIAVGDRAARLSGRETRRDHRGRGRRSRNARAIAARNSRMPITVITVPTLGPRTKPKALNVALPFARGTFTVIYDAEDRPEPNQLRRALQAFRAGGDDLACVQARLCIDNTADSWLARLFTAEYAGQFDVFLPGLAALHLPLPLGGSSNHFDTATLREVGGWDPYNVTEDADLGMRLARFGYRSEMIDSTTYEEAPAHFGSWLRQRTRWFKGWMQTWLVHMRQPRRLLRDLGPAGISHLPAHRRRQRAGGAGASAVHGRADLFGSERRPDVARRQRDRCHSRGALRHDGGDRLSDLGLPRLARPVAPRPAVDRLDPAVDAGALAAAVARGLARALSTRVRALRLGEDRAWPGENLAARRQSASLAAGTGAPAQHA